MSKHRLVKHEPGCFDGTVPTLSAKTPAPVPCNRHHKTILPRHRRDTIASLRSRTPRVQGVDQSGSERCARALSEAK
jgi:hypothetical protein